MRNEFLSDWQIIIGAIEHWLRGGNPYGPFPSFYSFIRPAGAFAYPPATLVLGAPLALLPWRLTGILMLLLSIIGFEYWARRTTRRTALPWLVIWLPLCQGLWIGQITLLALVGLALAELAATDRHDWRVGILLALAIVKPQTVVLPVAYMLFTAIRARRWSVLLSFVLLSAVLWGAVILISGPAIYIQWWEGLSHYGPDLPNRPLLFPPFGPLLALLAGVLWWRYGRHDIWGSLLLLNTLLFPLSVVYVAVGVVFVVIRWRPDVPWYPLALSWFVPILLRVPLTADGIAALAQAIVGTALLAGLCPAVPWRRLFSRWPLSPQ
jgi:hypothetical protein